MIANLVAAPPIFHRHWLSKAKMPVGNSDWGRKAKISVTANPDSYSAAVCSNANIFYFGEAS